MKDSQACGQYLCFDGSLVVHVKKKYRGMVVIDLFEISFATFLTTYLVTSYTFH